MIERIVLIKVEESHASSVSLQEIAEHSQRVLAALPGVRSVHVGVAADESTSRNWDLSLVLVFDSLEDLEPFRLHPDHRAYVDEYLKPMMTGIQAFNFIV
jgi:hypothetical protein